MIIKIIVKILLLEYRLKKSIDSVVYRFFDALAEEMERQTIEQQEQRD